MQFSYFSFFVRPNFSNRVLANFVPLCPIFPSPLSIENFWIIPVKIRSWLQFKFAEYFKRQEFNKEV